MTKNRNNTRFDIDSRGIRTEWTQSQKVYDSKGRLPNDSDAERESLRLYVASLINDFEEFGNVNSKGSQFHLPATVRDSDGFGSTSDASWTQFSADGKWVDAYRPLYEQIYGIADDEFLDNGGGARDPFKRKLYNVLALDSDGTQTAVNINTLLKLHLSRFLTNDFFEQRKTTDAVRNVFLEDSDVDLQVATVGFKNLKASNVIIDEANPNRVTTQSGDLELQSFSGAITTTANIVTTGTITSTSASPATLTGADISGNMSVDGNTTLGNAASDTLTVNSTASFNAPTTFVNTAAFSNTATFSNTVAMNGNNTFGNAASDTHGFTGDVTMAHDLTVEGVTTLNGNTVIGNSATDTQTITGITTHSGQHNVDNLRLDGNKLSSTSGALTLEAAGGTVNTPGNFTITGDLTVNGTTTTINTTNTNISDNIITVNEGEVGAGVTSGSAGIEVDRGSATNVSFVWDEVNDTWTTGTQSLTVGGDINVTGNLTYSDVTASNGTYTGNLFVEGNTTLGNASTDTLTVTATPTFTAAVTLSDNLTVTGVTTLNGNTVIGDASSDTVTVGAASTFNADATFTQDFTAQGTVTLGDNVADVITVNGTPTFAENATFSKNISVSGVSTFNGASTFSGNVSIGNASSDALSVTSTTTFSNAVTHNGNTTLGNTAGDTLTVGATSTFNAPITANGNVTLGNASTDSLTVGATSTFSENVSLSKNLTATGSTTLNGAVTLGDAAADTITVTGTATFTPEATFSGGIDASTSTVKFGTLSDGTISVTAFVDEDSMTSDSATLIPTQQSVKAYVDALETQIEARTITAGTGLTGGGDLSANRTVNVGAGTGITVNADDVAVSTGLQSVHSTVAAKSGTGIVQVTGANTVGQLADGTANQVLQTDGAGALSWFTIPAGTSYTASTGLDLTGTAFSVEAGLQSVNTSVGAKSGTGLVQVTGANTVGQLADGTANQVLQTDGAGTLSWATVSAGTSYTASTGITLTGTAFSTDDAAIDHDALLNFVANEHIDHSTVSITAGTGLTGGGTIAATRTLNVVGTNGITANADDISMSGTYTGDFAVTGNISATANVTAYSDKRLKSDIKVIEAPLHKINNLSGYTFTMTETGERGTGVIAQELEAYLPEAVRKDKDGYLSVAYGNVVGLLIEGMKAQQEQITKLQIEINDLKGK